MRLVAVELNDAGLVVARPGPPAGPTQLLESPGYALLHEGRVLVGEEAARRSRIAPLYAQDRFWQELGLGPLPWSSGPVQTQADLACAQLSSLMEPLRESVDAMLIAVPPGYAREQLGLLLAIADETGVPARGLVDLGLAASAFDPVVPHQLHLDLHLHQAVVTVLEHARVDSALRRTRYEILPGTGLQGIQQALMEFAATRFVRVTRFDPLHEAATEQRLFDLLPTWVAQAAQAGEVDAELDFGSVHHRVNLTSRQLADAVEHQVTRVLGLVQASRPAGLPVRLHVSARAGAVPGLLQRLATLRDCEIVCLERGAAALGALAHSDAILRPSGDVTLVHRLPIARGAAPGAIEAPPEAIAPEATPTHVLFRGRAWPIRERPLVLGWAVADGARALALPEGVPGLSRSHCTLARAAGAAIVEDHSTYGTFVNDERVAGRLALRVGDVLRLGTPGVSLELIRVLDEDGAPQV